ncbi:albumin-like [Rhinoderma darwinii]|uniref:albumin-like n=1 Tax=Rhinoderma darwinii TaxID=43563 RepID=UPI003F681E4D
MKWVTLICLLLCTIVTESRHLKKRDADHHSRHIGGLYLAVGESNLKHLLLVMLSQNFQKCTLEEHEQELAVLTTFAQHCADHEDEEDCKKPVITIFHNKVCNIKNLEERYPWAKECCPKEEPDREKCFHEHRDIKVEPFQNPDVEAACKEHKENPEHAFDHYIDNIAKRHSSLYPPAVLALAAQYNTIITECCAEEEKAKCFGAKLIEMQKVTAYIEFKQKHVCHILSTFPERVYQAIKIAKFSQKHPAANFDVVQKLALESVHLSKDCCKGNVVECMIERMEYTQHVCDNQEKLSPNLKACCEKPLLERTPCIIALPKDAVPEDLPKELIEFVEDEHVCQHFADMKDIYLAKFLYEFARRHPELSIQTILRVAKGYEGLLTKCCATEHPVECYKAAPQLFEAGIKEVHDLAKQNCKAYETLGPFAYNVILLSRYTPKMPQVSDQTLLEITGKMTKYGGKCCALPENQIVPCAEEKMDLLFGDMCERQSHTFINEQVRHCCVDSYSDRRPCFTKLGVDQSYKPPHLDESFFQVDAHLCEGSEEERKNKRLTLLIHIMKIKPDISNEKLKEIIEEFTKVREKCCAALDHLVCFDIEKPAFYLHVKTELEH